MPVTHCRHCNALLTPGAPFCLACFLPLEDEPPVTAVPTPTPVAAGVGAGAGYGAGSGAGGTGGPAADVPFSATPGNDFFATAPPPAPYGSPWQPPAPMRVASRRSGVPVVVVAAVCLVAVVGAVLGVRWMFGSPSEQQVIATAFREARPPDFMPTLPDLGAFTAGDGATEGPGEAKAFVQSIDPQVRNGSAALVAMQQTLQRWADGKATDDDVRAAITTLGKQLDAAVPSDLMHDAPPSTRRGLGKLTESVIEYRFALGALQDWLDSRGNGSRITYRLSVGSANVHWDEGLVALYRAGGLPAPPLPHPAKD